METRAEPSATSKAHAHPLGTVRLNKDYVDFADRSGITVRAEGVQPMSSTTSFNADHPSGELRELSSVHNLKGVLSPQRDRKYIIDWLADVKDSFNWPDMVEDEKDNARTKTFRGPNDRLVIEGSEKDSDSSWSSVRLSVDGNEINLCTFKSDIAKGVSMPGFVLYRGNPSGDLRERIRQCLSFSLGVFLVYLGCSYFDEDWRLTSFEAVSAYSLGGKAFELPPMPPAPLSMNSKNQIDRDILSRMVSSLYSNYDTLNFGQLSWAYWHARCATPHIAGVHYGAATETLQRSYLKANETDIRTKVVEEEKQWSHLKEVVGAAISALSVENDVKTILNNKLNQMNELPFSLLTEGLLDRLQLRLGEREKMAWKHRNRAAHGNDINEFDTINLIRDLKLLTIRFNRMLLSITKASDFYNDYFSLDHPMRKLNEAVPDEKPQT